MSSSPAESNSASPALAAGQRGNSLLVLDEILEGLQTLVPETHVGISIEHGASSYTTVVATDPFVVTLDEIQYELDEGPCITAMKEEHTVFVEDAESEPRWPTFIARAVDLGLRSLLGVPLKLGDRTVGGLNLYATTHTHFDPDQLAHARRMAALAASAIGQAEREEELTSALRSRRTVSIAMGLLMERFDLDDEEALAHLTRLSQRSNLEPGDIAEHLVKQSNDLRHWTRARQHGSADGVPVKPIATRQHADASIPDEATRHLPFTGG